MKGLVQVTLVSSGAEIREMIPCRITFGPVELDFVLSVGVQARGGGTVLLSRSVFLRPEMIYAIS